MQYKSSGNCEITCNIVAHCTFEYESHTFPLLSSVRKYIKRLDVVQSLNGETTFFQVHYCDYVNGVQLSKQHFSVEWKIWARGGGVGGQLNTIVGYISMRSSKFFCTVSPDQQYNYQSIRNVLFFSFSCFYLNELICKKKRQ